MGAEAATPKTPCEATRPGPAARPRQPGHRTAPRRHANDRPAYNGAMRAVQLLLLLGLTTTPLWAQTTPSNAPAGNTDQRGQLQDPEQLSGRNNQRTERIRVEDDGSRVDELRVGGQTQIITVQPKTGNMPGYEVQSPDGARSRAGSRNGAETTTAPRVWNVMKF